MMFPSMQHPTEFVWDFWYYREPEDTHNPDRTPKPFHVFYLNANQNLVKSEKHHSAAQIGYGITYDFIRMEWKNSKILTMPTDHWANTSIWSGDIIKIKNGYLLFYTSRNRNDDDGMTQKIGIAHAEDFNDLCNGVWNVSSIAIQPDPTNQIVKDNYEIKGIPQDLSIHAWRDPFLFRDNDGKVCMLLSAKSPQFSVGKNGVVGLLKMKDTTSSNWDGANWDFCKPIVEPNSYSEMEVPQLYKDQQGQYELVFSTWSKNDFSPMTRQAGGLQGLTAKSLKKFEPSNINEAIKNDRNYICEGLINPHVLMPEKSKLYACRIVPEMEGEIIGFDTKTGGIRRSGVKTMFESVNRNFDDLSYMPPAPQPN